MAPGKARRGCGLLAAILLTPGCSPSHKDVLERIYISNERGNSVAVVDPVNGSIVARFSPGLRPRGLLVSRDRTKLYVAVSGSAIGGPGTDDSKLPPPDREADGIAVIDIATGKTDRILRAGADPETFALGADGKTLFVSNEDTGKVSAVSIDGDRAPLSARVGEQPEGIVATPDGNRLFVACEASDMVVMLDAHSLQPMKRVLLKGRPRGALMSSDGRSVFVSVETGGKLAVISATTGAQEKTIDLALGDPAVRPMGIVEAPDGMLFITTGRNGAVLEVDPRSGKIRRRIDRVGGRPWGIGITSDGRLLATANGPSNDVSFIERASGKIIRKLSVGEGPWGIAGLSGGGAQ